MMSSSNIPAGVSVGVVRKFGLDISVNVEADPNRGRTETMFAELGQIETGRTNSRERSPQSVARRAVEGTLQKATNDLRASQPNLKLFPMDEVVKIYSGTQRG